MEVTPPIFMHKKRVIRKRMWLFFSLMFFLSGVIFLLVSQTQTQQRTKSQASGDCTVTSDKLQIKPQEQALFDQINAYRVSKRLPALNWSSVLKKPAAWMSGNMFASQNLNHTDSLGRTPDVRLADCGYTPTTYAETIAFGPQTPSAILNAWEGSPEHNAILLDPTYTEAGVAMEGSSTNQTGYWTVDFGITGSPTPLATATINPTNEPSATTAPSVTTVPSTTPEPSGTPEPTPTPGPTDFPTPTTGPLTSDMQIFVKVKISGIGEGGNIYPKHNTRRVIALVYDTAFNPVTSGTGYPVYDNVNYFQGTIHLGKMNQGVYFVKIMSDNTLQNLVKPELQVLKVTIINTLPAVTLYLGDITADNILSIDDYNIALGCFQQKGCPAKELIDFNDDGITDITDYNILLKSFGQTRGN